MVDTQHFCLRWNNYQSSITSAFENLRDDEDFVDVTLACDGKSLKAHRVVLSACSPYFRELLKSTPCKHPVIVLQDVAWTDLHALVEFIYHGEVNVHQRSLSSFLKTAEVLRVSGLTQQHGEDKDQLAQVQSLVRSHQSTPISNHHPTTFPDKLVEDALFPSPLSPSYGSSTVNQLLRRAAMHHRRDSRRISMDPEAEHKRARAEHIIGNNNNNELNLSNHTQPPQTQPADFSPSGMKTLNNALNLNLSSSILKPKNGTAPEFEGNGISSTDRENSPCSPSPMTNHSNSRCGDENVKSEPMEMMCNSNNQDDVSNDSTDNMMDGRPMENGPNSLPQGPHSGSSAGDRDDQDSSPLGPHYLTHPDTKLFGSAGSFNFSMAALAADPSALGGMNPNFGGNDTLAGTSQGVDEFRCQPCNKSLSSLTRLKRHIQNVHMRPSREPVCNICKRVYSSLNSLRNHKSIYHRNVVKNIKNEDLMAPPPPPPNFYFYEQGGLKGEHNITTQNATF